MLWTVGTSAAIRDCFVQEHNVLARFQQRIADLSSEYYLTLKWIYFSNIFFVVEIAVGLAKFHHVSDTVCIQQYHLHVQYLILYVYSSTNGAREASVTCCL